MPQVIQDNATRGSWKEIEKICAWVVCVPCSTHVLDLLLEDICKFLPVKILHEKMRKLRKFITKHAHLLATYKEKDHTMLTKPGETRFATVWIQIKGLLKNRSAVGYVFVSESGLAALARQGGSRYDVMSCKRMALLAVHFAVYSNENNSPISDHAC